MRLILWIHECVSHSINEVVGFWILIKLNLKRQDEWATYFDEYKADIQALQKEIDHTDAEIDRMVYTLYGLTEEEIKIVEAS